MCFLSKGRTQAILKESGKMPSDSARLMMVVIGGSRESMQDFKRKVGIQSKEQVELEDSRMAFLTSSVLAGVNSEREGGVTEGLM